MQAKIESGRVSFGLFELFESMPHEAIVELAEDLSCTEAIIRHVTAQLLDGWTDNACSGASSGASVNPFCALDVARRSIAERSGEVALKEIEGLKRALASALEHKEEYMNKYFELKRSMERI